MSKKLDSDKQTEKKEREYYKRLREYAEIAKAEEKELGGEKELPKRENVLKHSHGTGVGKHPNDSKLPEPKEEKCRLIKNAKSDPNWDGSLNAELCKGDCETCPYCEPRFPEVFCPFCGRKLIRCKQAWICGHGCTKPALKPKERPKTKPENDEPWECPICHKTVYIGYTVHRHCLDKLIEGSIKFIDHFEGRYEGNICGECLEYWKAIKEHYKGA